MTVHHYFIPHRLTHEKAKLLQWHFLAIYLLAFILMQLVFNLTNTYKPGVLGVNSQITVQEVIAKTNLERQKRGLQALTENTELDVAAAAKAENMFAENYWAHYSPSGKDPWGFINASGYKFSFAGENLARNFYTSGDVVDAWMNSPSHRDNLLNTNFSEIGIATVDGVLLGQKTTLVVQMFGKPTSAIALNSPETTMPKITEIAPVISIPPSVAGSSAQSAPALAILNPYMIDKSFGLGIVAFLVVLLVLDFLILKRRGIYRFSTHHLGTVSFLFIIGLTTALVTIGQIL